MVLALQNDKNWNCLSARSTSKSEFSNFSAMNRVRNLKNGLHAPFNQAPHPAMTPSTQL